MITNKVDAVRAARLGAICIFSYLTSYYMRNILGVSTPEMLATELYTKEFLGSLSSAYMLAYAIGQLTNGRIGDRVSAKHMVLCGLVLCGIASCAFPFCTVDVIRYILFTAMGFCLSTLRGPLVKTISENMQSKYARTCNVFLSFSSFAGPLIASLIAMLSGDWRVTFVIAGILCVAIGVIAYLALSWLEAKGEIRKTERTEEKGLSLIGGFAKVFTLDNFVFYMIISIIVEVCSISINFWLPTYLTERLGYGMKSANFVFSAMAFMRAMMPFLSLYLIKLFRENGVRMAAFFSALSAGLFVVAAFAVNKYVNVVLLTLSLMCVSCMSALVRSIYIPSLGKSGVVSTANGVLDFSGYFVASAANTVFALAVEPLGWRGVVLIWAGIISVGFISAIAVSVRNKSRGNRE